MIVPIDIENPSKAINDYLYPKVTEEGVSFCRVSNGKEWQYGMVVLKGGGMTVNELFAKIVDSKVKIPSVDDLLNRLTIYLEKIKDYKLDNIVVVESSDNEAGFEMKKYANRPSFKRNSKLP